MTVNPVIWFEIYVQNMQRARSFYEGVLKIKLEKLKDTELEMFSFPSAKDGAGASGALVKMQGVSSGGGGTLVYFHCDDCAVEEGRVVPAGGRIEKEKSSIGPYGFITLAVDTEGNMFGLHSMK